MKAEEMVERGGVITEPRREMEELADRLRPGANRAEVLRKLDQLFRTGTVPDPAPDGFLPGRLLGTSIWAPFDSFVARVAGSADLPAVSTSTIIFVAISDRQRRPPNRRIRD